MTLRLEHGVEYKTAVVNNTTIRGLPFFFQPVGHGVDSGLEGHPDIFLLCGTVFCPAFLSMGKRIVVPGALSEVLPGKEKQESFPKMQKHLIRPP